MSPVTLSATALVATPGGDAGCDVRVTNPSADRVAVGVEVDGPAAAWAVVVPATLVLAPGGSARARVCFIVPDAEDLAGSSLPFTVRVTGPVPATLDGRIDIAEVCDLRLAIRPLVARGRGTTTHTLTIENRGTRAVGAHLVGRDAAGRLTLLLAEARVTVAPGERLTTEVTVRPRRRLAIGGRSPRPFAVEVRPDPGPPARAEATRFQDPFHWRPWAAGMALAVLVSVVASAGVIGRRPGPSPATDPFLAAASTPLSPVPLTSGCPVPAAEALRVDIAGFAFCPSTLTVAAGEAVEWTNADLAPHTVTYDGPDGLVDSGPLVQGRSWSTRFDAAGTYRYYCRFHPGMSATIVVA